LLPANDGIIKGRAIIGDGELEPTFVAGRFRKRIVAGYRIHEMIHRTLEDHRADFCAIVDFAATRFDDFKIPLRDRGISAAKIHASLGCDYSLECERKQLVFVPLGQFAQDAEQRGQIGVWSVVRLIPLNRCPH